MRILMINHEFTVSGASTVFLRLASTLKAEGHEITIFPVVPQHAPMKDAFIACGIPIRDTIVDEVFDLAIANTICSAPVILNIGASIKTVWWIHEAEVGLMLILRNPHWIAAFHLAAAIVFQTPFQRDDIFRTFIYSCNALKIFVIQNGIVASPDDPHAEAAVVPVDESVIRVVSVGTIEPRKQHGQLIEAVRQLPALAIECVICGTYVDLDPRALATVDSAPSRYRLLTGLQDPALRAWVKSADVFCLPSVSETQGIAVYEAALLGKPLVLSDLPCYRGIFTHGRNALLFPALDIDLLAMTLEGLATRPGLRTRLGAAAQETARSWTQRRFLAEFASVLHFVLRRA
jgi:glycosyltransferase involved in cell wall biosynthesis